MFNFKFIIINFTIIGLSNRPLSNTQLPFITVYDNFSCNVLGSERLCGTTEEATAGHCHLPGKKSGHHAQT